MNLDPALVRAYTAEIQECRPHDDRTTNARLIDAIDKLRAALAAHRADIAEHLYSQLGHDETLMVPGVGGFTRSHVGTSDKWDKEAVRAYVRDSRHIDKDTGEIIDETPVDALLHVFPLGTPRVTALRERGATEEVIAELRHREPGRRSVKVIAADKKEMQ